MQQLIFDLLRVKQGLSRVRTAPSSFGSSAFVTGLAGVVLVAGYGYFYLNSRKVAADSGITIHQSVILVNVASPKKAPPPNEIIKYLRGLVKAQYSIIPGATYYIDSAFDSIEELHHTHKDEVDAILLKTYYDVRACTDSGAVDATTLFKAVQLGQLVSKPGAVIPGRMLEKHPEIKVDLGLGWWGLKQVVRDAHGSKVDQEATIIYDNTVKEVKDIFDADSSPGAKAAKAIWDEGQKAYGNKVLEEVKTLLTDQETVTTLLSSGGAIATTTAIWDRVRYMALSEAGFDERGVEDLKDFVHKKVQETKNGDTMLNTATSWLKVVPGAQIVRDAAPKIDIAALSTMANSRSEDAKQLAQETFSDLLNLLGQKAEKAKNLAEDDKDDSNKK